MTIQTEFARKTLKRKPLYALITSGLLTVASLDAMAQTGNPRVNQLGYVPNGAKTATYKTTSTSAQTWQLKRNGTVVATGQTTPFGTDAASGDNLHQIDLSSVTATGTGFSLTVGNDSSYNFAISTNALSAALYDSLKYFYHNRSGIAIETQYTGGGNGSFTSNSKWSRPAGHLNVGANKGDLNVPCWTGTCNYTLNVSKGWYDAGDHGKYVVNGGISVWTLLNLYERSLYLGNNSPSVADGKLNIPESANGIPDILDEARWEMEFMLGMQVPTGQTKAGMVHHKMHDVGWTGFPLAPHEDPQSRALVPPSTAATLNLAATAAQAARIWRDLDSGFAEVCLTAAQRAWDAAQSNPADIYSGNYDNGGGGYGDKTVADEFYWAAAELYITTGDSKYLSTLNNRTILQSNFGWADTDLAGLISLAIVPASQTASLRSAAQQKIVSIADLHIATQNTSGYPAPSSITDYYWGSNGSVANKLILMGLAYDFTKNDTYAKGVGKGLNFFFGQNTQSTSFITGEGTKAVTQPHHRFWSNATNSSYPTPPPGAFSGGPNAGLEDPKSAVELASCVTKPATCWMDHIEAYAVNEITINWNAPLAWNLAFYNDYAASGNSNSSSSVASSSVVSSSSVRSSSSIAPVSSSRSSSSVASSSSIRSSSSVVSSSSVRSSSSISSSSSSTSVGPRLDNPFSGARWYIDPVWSGKAAAEPGGSAVANNNTAVWMDRIGAIEPTDGSYTLRDHLDAALAQNANVIQVVVYDLPNRDCKALASNGELKQSAEGSARYRTEYVDKIASIFSDSKYASLRIIAIIEPDSLPNLVTNLNDPDCQAATDPTYGYIANTRYTLSKLYAIPNVYSYVDIGHSGWLGWDDNLGNQ